jgi:outer membrane protein assembly factor BamD (BamD/ComL family)
MASANNFIKNNLPKQAIEKLQTLVDKYPESPQAEQARKQIEEIKGID